jgi:hypothetical protein
VSVPYTVIKCSRCTTRWSSGVLFGGFTYILRRGRTLTVDRMLGWCQQCRSLTAVERLPLLVDLDDIRASLKDLSARQRVSRPTERPMLQYEIDRLKQKLSEQRSVTRFLKTRKSPPRCLNCSSINVEPVAPGFRHPGCGGVLDLQPSRDRVSFILEERYYSVEGRRVDTPSFWSRILQRLRRN